jgi:hypothetical protein
VDPDTVSEYEPLAQARMDPGAWAYYAGAAGGKVTQRENRIWCGSSSATATTVGIMAG